MLATAKAFEKLLRGINRKRRRFFLMKRTTSHPVAAFVLQLHIAANHLNNVSARENLFDKTFRDHNQEKLLGRQFLLN